MTRQILALAAFGLALATAAPTAFAQSPRKIDTAKSQIRFVTRQMNVPVEGAFRKFDATVAFDPAKPEATKAEFEVDLGSIDLGNADGDTEAKRKLWLNIDAFPKARFVARSVKQTGPGKYLAEGDLTIKGTTQKIAVPLTMTEAAGARVVEGQFPIKRLQYKIGEGQWSDTDTVADEVLVRFRFTLPAK
jgi:polyisoprenoid-binding protein YceI